MVGLEAVAGLTPQPSTVVPIAGTAGLFRDLGGPVNNDKRTEFAMVVIAAVVVGMIAVAHPASIPVIGVVAAVVALLLVWLKL